MTPRIRTATHDQLAEVTDLVADAFNPLSVSEWLVADPRTRHVCQRGQFGLVVEHAMEHGVVHLTEDRCAAAVWFDRTGAVPEPRDYDRRLREACGRHTPRFATLDAAFEEHHPESRHHHLAFLAVRPDRQGEGIGTAVLDHHHRELDRNATAAYLEASDAGTRDLYARHGYRVISVIDLPDGPSMWPMWRDPAPEGSAATATTAEAVREPAPRRR